LLYDAVLMHARFVSESVFADNRFVAGDDKARHGAEQFRCLVYFLGTNAGVKGQLVFPRANRHDNLFKRRVARSLADAVYRALDLPCAVPDGGDTVCDGHAKVVVTMGAQNDTVNVGNILPDFPEQRGHFRRDNVAHGVGQVHYRRTRVNDLSHDLAEVAHVAPRGVLGRKLDVARVLARMLDSADCVLERLFARFPQLVLQVNVGRSDKNMDSRMRSDLDCIPCGVDVGPSGARKARHRDVLERARDLLDRIELAGRRNGEPRFYNVNSQLLKLQRHPYLFIHCHCSAGRLLAVPERGIKNIHLFRHYIVPSLVMLQRYVRAFSRRLI
jgi:hypothetical protein